MESITVRFGTKEDLPILLDFEQELIVAETPFDPTFKSGKIHYYDLEEIMNGSDSAVFVAEFGAKVIGSGHVRTLPAKSYNSFDKYAFLGFMFVVPEFRGRGVNQLIISEIKRWAKERNLNELRLQVYDENISAIKAYEKVNFKKYLVEMRMSLDEE